MVRRLYRTVAVAGALSLLNASSVQSGTIPSVIEENTRVQAVVTNRTTNNNQTEGRGSKHERPRSSEFFALSCLLLDNAFLPGNAIDSRISAFDPAVVDRFVSANAVDWASSPIKSGSMGRSFKTLFNPPVVTSERINIQPLAIRKDSPAFGNFVATILPHSKVLSTDDRYAFDQLSYFESNSSLKTASVSKELQGVAPIATVKAGKTPLSYSYKTDKVALNSGISWIKNLADSRGGSETFQKAGFEGDPDKVPGVNFNLGASYQALSLTGGYIRAIDRYATNQPSFTGNEAESGAWSSEIAYTTELLRKDTVLAVGYQKSSESMKLYLPEQRYITKASMVIFDGTIFSLEYYRDRDYSVKNGGNNSEGYGIATKIGFEFQVDR